jgi:tetratricopeptide (TPR) repeat protein
VAFNRGRIIEQTELGERALFHAQRLPSGHHAEWSTIAAAKLWGPTPAREVVSWIDENRPPVWSRNHRFDLHRAVALAMSGETAEATASAERIREELNERGRLTELAMAAGGVSRVHRLAGDPERAEAELAEACDFLEERGERSVLSTAAALRALALIELDRLVDAELWADKALELASADDVFTQLPARRAQALLLSARGEHDEAERVARDVLELAEATDMLTEQGESLEVLGQALGAAGRTGDAATAFERAAETFARKGDVVSDRRVGERLAAALS